MPRIAGISCKQQLALIDILRDLLAAEGLDADIERRATWLMLGLTGRVGEDEMRLAHVA